MADIFSQVLQIAFEVLGREDALKLQEALKGLGDVGDDANAKLAPLVDELTKLGETSAKVQEAIDLSDRLAKTNTALEEAKKALADLNEEFDKSDKSSTELNVAFQQAEKNVKSLAAEQLKLQNTFASSVDSLKAAGVNTNDLSAANQKLKTDTSAAAQKLTETAAGMKNLGDESQRSANLVTVIADNLGKIVTIAAATKLALAGIRFAGDSFEGAAKVEDQLERVRVTAKATQEQFEKFGPAIGAAAREVNTSTDQAAQALAELVKQGKSADEALTALVPTLRLAKIAQIDVAQAAGIVGDALDRFGLGIEQSGEVVDVLVTASNGAAGGILGIANAMQTTAPLARELGLTFKDTAAILGLLQQNGFSAEKAARGLSAVFTQLQDPTSKLRENLFALGDTGSDFATAIDTIAGAGDKGKKTLTDLDGASRTLVTFLVQRGTGALNDFSASLDAAGGSAATFVDSIKQGAGESFSALTNAIDSAARDLAQPFLAPVSAELRKLAEELNAFAQTPQFDAIKTELVGLATDAVAALDKLIHGLDWQTLATDAHGAVAGLGTDLHSLAKNTDAVVSGIGKVVAAITILKNVGDIGVDVAKAVFGGTTQAAVNAALAISIAQDKIRGSVSGTTVALQKLSVTVSALTTGPLKEGAADSAELAAAVLAMGSAAEKAGPAFKTVESGVSSTAEALGKFNDEVASGPPAVDALTQSSEQLAAANVATHNAIVQASDAANAAHDSFRNLQQSGTATADELDKAADAALQADAKLARLLETASGGAPKVISLADALKLLGPSQDDLKAKADQSEAALNALYDAFLSGTGKIEDVRAEFAKWAADLRASVANSDSWKQQLVEDQISVKASALGVTNTLGNLGNLKIPTPDTSGLEQGLAQVHEGIGKIVGDTSGLTFQTQQQADAFEELGGKAGSTGNLLNVLQGEYSRFAAVSGAAVEKFTQTMKAFFEGNTTFSQQAITDSTNIIRAGEAAVQAGQFVQKIVDQQRQGVADLAAQYANMSDDALRAFAAARGGADQLQNSLAGDAAAAREGRSAFDLLGAADLSGLASALDSASQKLEQIKEQAQQAKDALASIGDSLKDEIDQLQGNQTDIENRRFQNQLDQIKQEAELAGTLNSSETNKLLQDAKILHELKLKQIKEQQDAQKAADDQKKADDAKQPKPPPDVPPDGTPPPAPPPTPGPTKPQPRGPITLNIEMTINGLLTPAGKDQLARELKKIIDDINGRST